MKVTKVINGIEYEFEIPFNQEIAGSICQSYYGYKITSETSGYTTRLYKVNTSAFLPKETKLIGTLIYNFEKDCLTLYKHVNDDTHKFLKFESYGINNEIVSRLRANDQILISNDETMLKISVRNALKVGKYMQFDKYERQLFIPLEKFKEIKKK